MAELNSKENFVTRECDYDDISVRPSVLSHSHNAYAPVFVRREVAWRAPKILKNSKYKVNLYVFVGYIDKHGKKRKRERTKTKTRRRLSKVQRERERRIARVGIFGAPG